MIEKMNEHERQFIMIKSRGLRKMFGEYCEIISEQLEHDEEKLNNLPTSLENSELYSQIENNVEQLQETMEIVESIQEQFEDIPNLLEFEYRKERKQKQVKIPVDNYRKEKRTERLQAVIPPTMGCLLRTYAAKCNISVNEILNRFLEKGLSELIN